MTRGRFGPTIRALARVEVREVRKHRRRSALIIMLVAVPVAAVMGAATLARITAPTPDERIAAAIGQANLRVDTSSSYEDLVRVQNILGPDAPCEALFVGQEKVRVPGRELRAKLIAASPTAFGSAIDDPAVNTGVNGLAEGMLLLREGRVPANAGELALSPTLLEGLDCAIGDTVTLAYGPARIITGIVFDPEDVNQALVLRTPAHVEHAGKRIVLANPPESAARAMAATLREAGFATQLRMTGQESSEGLVSLTFVVGAIGFFEAGLVIAAAFAVSLRRRQREIGLIGSVGAAPLEITLSVLTSAAFLAAIGGIVGVLVGSVAALAAHPFLDGWNGRWNGPFELSLPHAVGAITLGIVAAMAAAVVPAWSTSRVPVRDALGSSRPVTSRSRTSLLAGLTAILAGLALLSFGPRGSAFMTGSAVTVGPILGIIGFAACSPWLLDWLARRAARLPLAWRLAVRDAGRFRARNGPVVAAVLAAISMTVTAAILVASLESAIDLFPSVYRNDQLIVAGPAAEEVAEQLEAELPCIARSRLMAVYTGGQPVRARFVGHGQRPPTEEWIACGDEELLRALGMETGVDAFQEGKLLVLDPPEDTAELALTTWLDGRALTSPAQATAELTQRVRGPLFVIDAAVLTSLGMEAGPPLRNSLSPWIVRLDRPVTRALLDRAQSIAAQAVGTSIDAGLLHQRPTRTAYRVALAACVLTGLVVVLVAVSLSAAESVADERVLWSVGAAPGQIRAQVAARAAYLSFVGSALAIPAGAITAVALVRSANMPLRIVWPWIDLLVALLALPTIAYLATWLFGSRRETSRRGVDGVPLLPSVASISVMMALMTSLTTGHAIEPAETSQRDGPVRWQPYTGKAFDGSPLVGELGRLRVPESREDGRERQIELAFVRYRTSNPRPGPPIFFLAGGPGGSGVEMSGPAATHPQIRLLEHCDVIGLDQRGTGLSHPNLMTGPRSIESLPPGARIGRDAVASAVRRVASRCANHWSSEGVDLSAYNSRESAEDLDDLRRALGLEQVVLYGSSYGSHLGLAYLRRHAASVERAVLLHVEGPNHTWKLPSTVQDHLTKIHKLAADDPVVHAALPDLNEEVRLLLQRLDTSVSGGVPAEADSMVLGPLDLQCWLSNALGTTEGIASIPRTLYQCRAGDWSGLAETARELRRIEVPAILLAMDCASGATDERWRRIEAERRDPTCLLSDAIHAPFYSIGCEDCGVRDLGSEFRDPIYCDVPVLFVSGDLDVRTPVQNVGEIAAGFSQSEHVVVENAAHDSRELMSEEYRDLLQAFLRGDPIASCTISLPPIRFSAFEQVQREAIVSEAARQPASDIVSGRTGSGAQE